MIQSSILLTALFTLIVAIVVTLSKSPKTAFLFKYLPSPLWCYFIPTVFSSLGVIPQDSPLYGAMGRALLPACLFLLLFGSDLGAILRLSPKAVGAMLAGTVGIWLGGIATFAFAARLFKGSAQFTDLWKGWGSLGATWTGGSANMIAVREILAVPEALLSNLILTDTVIAYSWMAVLVFLSQYQPAVDGWLGAGDFQEYRKEEASSASKGPLLSVKAVGLAALAFGFSAITWRLATALPEAGRILNRPAWAVLIATFSPLLISLTPVRAWADRSTEFAGNFLLFVLLTSIGARAKLDALGIAPWLILAGFVWTAIHGLILALYGRWTRTPLALLAAASQANVGGTISAPLVATLYRSDLASLAVLLAVLGNIYGTYAGLILAEICRLLANVV